MDEHISENLYAHIFHRLLLASSVHFPTSKWYRWSCSICITDEPEVEGSIPFLDAHVSRSQDGNLKVQVYCKKTHIHQHALQLPPPLPAQASSHMDTV